MGVKKAAAKKSTRSGGVAKAAKTAISKLTGKKSGGGRRSRVTPEKLSRKILVEKLKKRLYRIKYGSTR